MKNFAIFIISYKRAGKIQTIDTMKSAGYTGDWYIVIEDQDPQKKKYYKEYKEGRIIEFNKEEVRKQVDMGDNRPNNDTALLPRQALFGIARDLNLDTFLVLDDDYTSFHYRFDKNANSMYSEDSSGDWKMEDLDHFLEKWVEYYQKTDVDTMTLAQGRDFIGGADNVLAQEIQIKRKAMNTWLLSPDREFPYLGRMNNDVNTYIRNQQLGKIMFMLNHASIVQANTQQREGGLTELYLDQGTYVKSFYTLLYSPSCAKIGLMGDNYIRIHHKINWKYAVPKILDPKYQKARGDNHE